jgi:hypothetical protein
MCGCKMMSLWGVFQQAEIIGGIVIYFPKNLWVNVAIKLISINRPTTASTAANRAYGSPRVIS